MSDASTIPPADNDRDQDLDQVLTDLISLRGDANDKSRLVNFDAHDGILSVNDGLQKTQEEEQPNAAKKMKVLPSLQEVCQKVFKQPESRDPSCSIGKVIQAQRPVLRPIAPRPIHSKILQSERAQTNAIYRNAPQISRVTFSSLLDALPPRKIQVNKKRKIPQPRKTAARKQKKAEAETRVAENSRDINESVAPENKEKSLDLVRQLKLEIIGLRWALLKSELRNTQTESDLNQRLADRFQVPFLHSLGTTACEMDFPTKLMELVNVTQAWSLSTCGFLPNDIQFQLRKMSSQEQFVTPMQALCQFLFDAMEKGEKPPGKSTLAGFTEKSIISVLKTLTKASKVSPHENRNLLIEITDKAGGFLEDIFNILLKAPSDVKLQWSTSVVGGIVRPLLEYGNVHNSNLSQCVGSKCRDALRRAAHILSSLKCDSPQIHTEACCRAIELSMALLSLLDFEVIASIPIEVVYKIGSRNILFSVQFAQLQNLNDHKKEKEKQPRRKQPLPSLNR